MRDERTGGGGVPVSDVVVHVVFGEVEHVLGQHLRLPGVPQAQLRSQVQYLEDHRYMRPGTTICIYLGPPHPHPRKRVPPPPPQRQGDACPW
jgi:hypothetical protein